MRRRCGRRFRITSTRSINEDIEAVCACWGDECSHTDRETGERTEGREAIRSDIAAVFESRPETRLSGHVDHVRFISQISPASMGKRLSPPVMTIQ